MYRLIAAAVLVLTIALGGYTQSTPQGNRTRASYSKAQADQGKIVYGQKCATCHLETLKGKCSAQELGSIDYVCGATGSAPPLVGDSFMKRFYSANDLFQRVKWTMPANRVNSLSDADNLAVVAYLLQANGVPASADLQAESMKDMVLNEAPFNKPTAATANTLNSLGISQSYYTNEQAERGKGYFYGSCGFCHTAEAKTKSGTMEPSTGLGWHRGPVNSFGNYSSDNFLTSESGQPGRPTRWQNVANLFFKVSTTQPAYAVALLSQQAYLDMIAYILKQQGLPAGKDELTGDVNQLRNMPLEKGFERIFNGKDFTGWSFLVGGNCQPQPKGCGDTTPGTTFKITDGTIFNTGTPHGFMYPTGKKYWNFDLRLEYKLLPFEGMESDTDLYTNTGYFLFIPDDEPLDVWPRTLEIQGKNDFEMSVAMGRAESTLTYDEAARARARKPAGQWNSIQIVSKDGQVWTYLNGTPVTHITKHAFTKAGYLGFQVESGPVQWRNMRIKAE